MEDNAIISHRLSEVEFSFYTKEMIKKMSLQEIYSPIAFDNLFRPISHGLYDPLLGVSPYDHISKCATCGLGELQCPGHFGHIELTAPVYNVLVFPVLYKLMRAKCFNCHKFKMNDNKRIYFALKFRLIRLGLLKEAAELLALSSALPTVVPREISGVIGSISRGERLGSEGSTFERTEELLGMIDEEETKKKPAKKESKAINEIKKKTEEKKIVDLKVIISKAYNARVSESNTAIQKAMKEVTKEFWAVARASKKCPHCHAISFNVKKDGYTKIFRVALSEKDKGAMRVLGIDQERITYDELANLSESSLDEDLAETIPKEHHGGDLSSDFEDESEDIKPEPVKPATDGKNAKQAYMHQLEIREHLVKLWRHESELMDLMFGKLQSLAEEVEPYQNRGKAYKHYQVVTNDKDMFFIHLLVVPPNRFRPESKGEGDEPLLHRHTVMLTRILNLNLDLKNMLLGHNTTGKEGRRTTEEIKKIMETRTHSKDLHIKAMDSSDIVKKWIELQDAVNVFIDSAKAMRTTTAQEFSGIRQLLERKEGLFRMKMMGKRVNFAARSVISPDPYINTNEIGIPVFMAKKLTFPEPVAAHNAHKLRKLVTNGADIYPGANIVEDERGVKTQLSALSKEQRKGIAKTLTTGKKVVYRHMETGDALLLNRQPSLHRASIMGHKARVLPREQTIRMHYANCSSYNADFDGDEMNAHFIQNQLARSEGYNIMSTDSQYIIPTSGRPLRGLIQDSVVSSVFLTSKRTMLSKSMYQELVYVALRNALDDGFIKEICLVEPAILKPEPTWTGKQVITTILKSLLSGIERGKKKKGGLYLTSKSKLPANVWGPYGAEEGVVIFMDCELLSGVLDKNQFGATEFGFVHAFHELYGPKMAAELLNCLGKLFTVFLQLHGFTCAMNHLILTPAADKKRQELIEEAFSKGIQAAGGFAGIKDEERVRENVRSGVEKKLVLENNADVELDQVMMGALNSCTSAINKSCLPIGLMETFPANLMSAMVLSGAKGSEVNHTQISCLLGQQALEGRRVPITPSGRSLPSFLPYDPHPRAGGFVSDRFLTGLHPQEFFFHCMAGREGLVDTAVKTSRCGYLQRCLIKQLESLIVNYDLTVRDGDGSIVQFYYGEDAIDPTKAKYMDQFKFITENSQSFLQKHDMKTALKVVEKKKVKEARKKGINTVMEHFLPSNHLGAISEKIYDKIQQYIFNNPDNKLKKDGGLSTDSFEKLCFFKYFFSLAHPGENVGIIASEAIGEPSTQMTLNTFHLAGHGGMNVTLGIPRLREILMTAGQKIKTPNMALMPLPGITREQLELLANKLKRVRLEEVVRDVQVTHHIETNPDNNQAVHAYSIQINLEDLGAITHTFDIKYDTIVKIFKNQFVDQLVLAISKELKKGKEVGGQKAAQNIRVRKAVESKSKSDEVEEMVDAFKKQQKEEEEIGDIEGYEGMKQLSKKQEQADYDLEDDDIYEELMQDIDNKAKSITEQEPVKSEEHGKHNVKSSFKSTTTQRGTFQVQISFPLECRKVLMLEHIQRVLNQVMLRSIKGIDNCFVSEHLDNGKKDWMVQTQGINLQCVVDYSNIIDINRISCNDVTEVLTHFGVEAARQTIVRELKYVFGVYGITIDYRHLCLIADFMTHNGQVHPFNRVGMEENASPFLKMSFETTMNYLTKTPIIELKVR